MLPKFLIVMGVAGCGKSTIGERLAVRLGSPFLEGDQMHPPENIEKMTQGVPLMDADRLPWLQAIAKRIAEWRDGGKSGVVTCSALRESYRKIITDGFPDVRFIYLHADRALIAGASQSGAVISCRRHSSLVNLKYWKSPGLTRTR